MPTLQIATFAQATTAALASEPDREVDPEEEGEDEGGQHLDEGDQDPGRRGLAEEDPAAGARREGEGGHGLVLELGGEGPSETDHRGEHVGHPEQPGRETRDLLLLHLGEGELEDDHDEEREDRHRDDPVPRPPLGHEVLPEQGERDVHGRLLMPPPRSRSAPRGERARRGRRGGPRPVEGLVAALPAGVARTRPRWRTIARSARATARRGSWVTTTRLRARPEASSRWLTRRASRRAPDASSRPVKGSSSSRSDGAWTTARAIARRWAMPREKVSARRSATSSEVELREHGVEGFARRSLAVETGGESADSRAPSARRRAASRVRRNRPGFGALRGRGPPRRRGRGR